MGRFTEIRTYVLTHREKEAWLDSLAASLAGREEIVFAYVHGSFLEDGPFRDLDIGVHVREDRLPASPMRTV